MKIIVTGVKGQLGFDILRVLEPYKQINAIGIDIDDLDITNKEAVEKYVDSEKPDIIIHCAAYTAVDLAEDYQELCMNVNVEGTKHLVKAAKKHQTKFLYISTDYVFDGTKNIPYHIDDKPNPQSVYGKSKYLGEVETRKLDEHFIVRIAWVFGKNGQNFIKTMLRLSKERESISVVNDQMGTPTYTFDLAKFLVKLIQTNKYGTYHATNEGECTWYEFTKEIFKQSGINTIVKPIASNEYPTKAKRPMNSRLSKKTLDTHGFKRLPDWKDALNRYLKEIEVI